MQAHSTSSSLANHVASLSEHLHACRDFESAGAYLLRSMFDSAAVSLREMVSGVEVLRGTIHFRPEDEYRRLFCLECDDLDAATKPLRLPSLTAWRWISTRACSVTIDVEAQLLRVFEGGAPRMFRDASNSIRLDTGETCQRLTARDADYVVAYPLRRHGGIVDGMVSLELRGTRSCGEQIPAIAGPVLQLLVDLATPHLAWLPGASVAPEKLRDEYLPVVGSTMAPMVELLRVFSRLEETLLVAGPTGVGKSRLARYCHAHSSRRDKPFVTLDLLACPENLQMPQLCGSRKGSYTGADRDMPGAIQRAEGGTLFIDEIDKLSLPAQAGLLRLIEDRVYRPLGDSGDDRKANVRFIVGTSANLRDSVRQGRFREDLYYRIAVLMVRVPPLAERKDEIPAWANYMLERCQQAARDGQSSERMQLDYVALERLKAQTWPGNLRQLDNVVRRAYAYSFLDSGSDSEVGLVSDGSVSRAIHDEHDEQSRATDDSSVVARMRAAARAFAAECLLRRTDANQPLLLTHADAFRAMVLEATLEACDQNKDRALEALGLGNVVRDRNQHRFIKRESEQLQRLHAVMLSEDESMILRP